MTLLRCATAAVAVSAGLALAGCGAGHPARTTTLAAAEPDHSPALRTAPAGHSVHVGTDPQGIAVTPRYVAVAIHSPVAIALLNPASGRLIKRIPIAADPRHLALVGVNGPLLVPEERADRLAEVDLPSGRTRTFITGEFPHAVAAVGPLIFVGNEHSADLTEIRADGARETVHGFRQPGGAAVSGQDLAVVDVAAFTLTLLDTAHDNRVIGRLPAGAGPTHDGAASGRVYVLDTRGNALLTYSVSPFRRLARTSLPGGPYGIAVDARRHRLWVTETASNRLVELTIASPIPRVLRSYATGRQPDTVAVDPGDGHVYVANQLSGTVQFITPSG